MWARAAARLRPRARVPVASWPRHLRATPCTLHGSFERRDPASPEDAVNVIVTDRNGVRHEVVGKVGDNLLYVFHKWRDQDPSLALEGACEASLACSTCHVIVRRRCHAQALCTLINARIEKNRRPPERSFDAADPKRRDAAVPRRACACACACARAQIDDDTFDQLEEPCEEEEDMLDLAVGLTVSSRLGCQIILTKEVRAQAPWRARDRAVHAAAHRGGQRADCASACVRVLAPSRWRACM